MALKLGFLKAITGLFHILVPSTFLLSTAPPLGKEKVLRTALRFSKYYLVSTRICQSNFWCTSPNSHIVESRPYFGYLLEYNFLQSCNTCNLTISKLPTQHLLHDKSQQNVFPFLGLLVFYCNHIFLVSTGILRSR